MIRPSRARAAAAMVWLSPRQRVRATCAAASISSWSSVVIVSAFVGCLSSQPVRGQRRGAYQAGVVAELGGADAGQRAEPGAGDRGLVVVAGVVEEQWGRLGDSA